MFASAGSRELFYCRNPGDARVKVGSDREAASLPVAPKPDLDEIGTLALQIMSAGTLQNWPCYMGIYSEKLPYNTVGFCAQIVGAVI